MTKLAIITGGGRGIGAATAKRLARDGYRLIITYHSDSKSAEEVVSDIRALGSDAVAMKVDCSEVDEVRILAEHPWVRVGIDALILNHAIYERVGAGELDEEGLTRTLEVNFTGAFRVWKALSHHLRDDARIVVLGSQLGIKGTATGADYSASKGALHAWARSLAVDVAEKGQRVNVVAPGTIETDLVAEDSPERRAEREATIPMGRLGGAEEVASVISFLISDDSSYVTGAIIHVNGGLFRP